MKTGFPTKCIVMNISFSFCIPLELWTAFMGYTCKSNLKIREKSYQNNENSEYLAHSESSTI